MASGISEKTFYLWKRDQPTFAAAVEQARVGSGSGLGPLLPLPLIDQVRATNRSVIVEQPTDLRPTVWGSNP